MAGAFGKLVDAGADGQIPPDLAGASCATSRQRIACGSFAASAGSADVLKCVDRDGQDGEELRGKDCGWAASGCAAPTALASLLRIFPAFTRWASLCHAFGVGYLPTFLLADHFDFGEKSC